MENFADAYKSKKPISDRRYSGVSEDEMTKSIPGSYHANMSNFLDIQKHNKNIELTSIPMRPQVRMIQHIKEKYELTKGEIAVSGEATGTDVALTTDIYSFPYDKLASALIKHGQKLNFIE